MNKRPNIICHMLMSIDGKVTGDFLFDEKAVNSCEIYYQLHRNFKADGFICGRVTMEESFTKNYYPDLSKYSNCDVSYDDYIYKNDASFFAIAFDRKGKLGWKSNIINDEDYNILLSMPKKVRELNIGMMIKKDISIFKHIKNGIIKAKELFFNINNIEDREVLSIKNDAIFLMGTRNIQCNVNELFTFVPKNTYTFYMKSMHLQIFYGYNQI